jgi:SIR2-like protein
VTTIPTPDKSSIEDVHAPPVAGATSTTSSLVAPIHDASQQIRNLRQVLQDDKQRIGCFLGAGCPLGVYDAADKESIALIPAVVELTKRVASALEEIDKSPETPIDSEADATDDAEQKAKSSYKKWWDALRSECKLSDGEDPTVEDVLTELRTLASRRGSAEVLGMTKANLSDLDDKICSLVTEQMKKALPPYRNSYTRFASWIAGLHRLSPIEVFTPNYDLLFEQAFEQNPLPHFDGFVGSREPWFDLASIEHDVIPARWTRLWKLHGSINWEKIEETVNGISVTRVVRVTRAAAAGKVMIFPSHLKYDQSRRMPYLAMLDRLRAFFHGGITGKKEESAPRLIVCGYSFLDEHLNEVLLDGLRGNRNAQCFALMHSNLNSHPRVVEYATKQGNLTVLARDGAVIGTRTGRYRRGATGNEEYKPWLYEEGLNGVAEPQTSCRLGDFHYFGLFLERLSGGRGQDAHPSV